MIIADNNTTTAGRIAETIGERIISGALQPDAPLRQDHVAREFNSSHVPVREAFRQLEAQHLVVGVPRRGVRVAPLDANSVKEIAEMRAALEVVALRNAAPKLTPAHMAKIELALIEGDNAETLQDFETAPRLSPGAGGALRHAASACQPRRIAIGQFPIGVRDGAQCRLAAAIQSGSSFDLQALRTRNLDQACSLLTRHIQTIERLTAPGR